MAFYYDAVSIISLQLEQGAKRMKFCVVQKQLDFIAAKALLLLDSFY